MSEKLEELEARLAKVEKTLRILDDLHECSSVSGEGECPICQACREGINDE